jgi:[protein-PII] uridylyltransferase
MNDIKQIVQELLHNNAPSFQISNEIKKHLDTYTKTLSEIFMQSSGKDFLVKHTRKIDSIIQLTYMIATRELFGNYMPMKHSIPIALVALGSYGREQLCVHSDIDLMIVYEDIEGYNTKALIEKILYILWDSGLKLGHRVHLVSELTEVSKTDITIKTAIMESRYIEGSKAIWTNTQNMLTQIRQYKQHEFIKLKIEESIQRHNNLPLTMEPNIKDGIGGFRDANLVFWIGKVLYNVDNIKQLPIEIIDDDEYREFRIALEFLFRTRSALHIVTGKKEDKLRLELIPEISKLLGFSDDFKYQIQFSKQIIESLKTITLYSKIWVYKMSKILDETVEILAPCENSSLKSIFGYLVENSDKCYKAHPLLLEQLLKNKNHTLSSQKSMNNLKKLFYTTHSYCAFSAIYEAGILGNIIAPLKKVTNLPQFDGYHTYPVDEHSIRGLFHLEEIGDELLLDLYTNLHIDKKAILKLIVLLHDAGKGRQKDHSEIGALLFKSFALKLGFESNLIKTGELLILHHTLMSRVAQREDLHNEKIIMTFASKFKDKETIDMLYLLTYADISAVGDGVLGSFTQKLLRTLYDNSLKALNSNELLSDTAKRAKKEQQISKSREFSILTPKEQKAIFSIQSNLPFLRYSTKEIIEITQMGLELSDDYVYKLTNNETLTIEIVRAKSLNLGYLLGKLSHLEVVNMEICKLFNDLKYFKIEYSENITDDDIMRLREIIKYSFNQQKSINLKKPEILAREIEIDCDYSAAYASMKLNTKNQKGLLAYIANLFDELGVDIESAKLHSMKNRTRDTFLIQKNGNFCHNTKLIIQKLTEKS